MSLPFSFTRPSNPSIQALLDRRDAPLTYDGVGLSRDGLAPAGYAVNARRAVIGRGERDFEAACAAVRRWEMFGFGWVDLCWPDAPIEDGATVAVLAHRLGLWSLNPCRVVYTIDDQQGALRRFGLGYGTLPEHVMRGEERFMVTWNHETGEVVYSIHAFARASSPLIALIRPALTLFQRQFARASMQAMARAVRAGDPTGTV
ncbi:MAG: DUF1990 domain-containing protein [Myxococcales bacterium]|nr:DUF1990 domain-containing protein [Myxococcales bacterium]